MTKILNDFHYKAKIITEDQYFKDFVSFLLSKFDNLGCPIPDKGFKNDKEYEEWRKLYWQIVDKNKGKSLPPLFKIYIKELVVYYKIEEKYKKYFEDFFLNYIFFKKDYYPHPGFTISWKNNKRTNEHELYIRIFSHTTKENIIKNWSIVKNEKKLLNDWSKKKQKQKGF